MQLKEKNRNEIAVHKKRLEKHRDAIERDVEKATTKDKVVENIATKKKVTKKRVIDKKAMKERHKAIAEKVMDDALKGKADIEKNSLKEEREESTTVITKEERAKRFKRLHAMVQDMIKKRNE